MPKYIVNGKTYNIPDDKVEGFENKYPNATVEYHSGDKTYQIPLNKRDGFLKQFPNASTTAQPVVEAQPQEPAQPTRPTRVEQPLEQPRTDSIRPMQQPRVVSPTSTPDKQEEYVEGFGAGWKQGWKGLVEGAKYFAGEAANLVTGSSLDDAGALAHWEQLEQTGQDIQQPLLSRRERQHHEFMSSNGGDKLPMVVDENGNVRPPTEEEKQEHRNALQINEYNQLIHDAIEEAGGDLTKAKQLLSSRAADKSWGDKIMENASEEMSKMKPTKGFGAWVGNLVPQMLPSAAAMVLSVATKSQKYAKMVGGLGMGAMTVSTAGQSMKEARDAGASTGQVWAVGIADGAIELATEKLPFDRYTTRLFNGTKAKVGKELAEAVADNHSPARNELEKLLTEANKKLGGKLLNGKNVKDYAADILAEGASEFTAEALQTITPIIYENPEDYPTINEILQNGWEGAKAGLFMGAVLGGASKSIEHQQQRSRRKQQGFVDVAQVQVKDDGTAEVGEVVGVNRENGNLSMLVDGEVKEFAPESVKERHRFTFEEFDTGVIQMQEDEAYDNGYSLEQPQEMNDAKNEYEYQQQNMRRIFGLAEGADVDAEIGNPIEKATTLKQAGVQTEEVQALLDYANAKATFEGMLQRQRDDIDSRITASNEMIDSRVSQNDGMIHPALMNVDDRRVYVVSGNIVMNNDNTMIDRENSDESIIVRDAETGELEFTEPSAILRVEPSIDPASEKEVLRQQITEEFAQQAANKIDGVLEFQPNEQYTLTDEQGVQHTATIVMDNGDNTVSLLWDNEAEPTIAEKEVVQQMHDATNLVRLQQFEQQRAAERIALAEAEREAQRPVYNLNDHITVRTPDGDVRGQITSNANEDGLYEIYTEHPIQGKARVAQFTREELDAMVVEHNGGSTEMVEQQPQVMQPTVEPVQQTLPIEQPAQVVEREQQQQEQQEPVSALARIPVDEQGNQEFEKAPVQDSWAALVEMNEGDEVEALDTAQQMLSIAQKELDKALKQKPKGGSTVSEIQQNKAAQKAKVKHLQSKVQYWSGVAGFQAEQKRMAEAMAKIAKKEQARKMRAAQDAKGRYSKEDAQLGDYLDFRDYAMRTIATGAVKFKWKDNSNGTKGLGSHLGLKGSRAEMSRRIWLLNSELGDYPEVVAEGLLQGYADAIGGNGYAEDITGMTTMDAFNEVLDVVQSYDSPRSMFEAAQGRHTDIAEAQADEYAAMEEYARAEAQAAAMGMSVEDWLMYEEMMQEIVLPELDNITDKELLAIFADAYDAVNTANYERGRENNQIQSGVSERERLAGGDADGNSVLPNQQPDNAGAVGQSNADGAHGIDVVGQSGVVDVPTPVVSATEPAVVDGTGLEQTNDEQRQADGSRVVEGATATMGGGIDRGDIRVLEEGLDATYGEYLSDSERTRRNKESERLVTLAKQNGLFIPLEQTKTLGTKYAKRTGESAVYLNEEAGKVFKVKNPYAKSAMKSGVQPEDAIFEHTIHNLLFPETAYTFEGISEDLGDVRIVLSQQLIRTAKQPTQQQIVDALAARGLFAEDKYSFGNELVSVTDVEGDNVLLGEDGTVYFIDPIIKFKKPARDIIDALTAQSQPSISQQIEQAEQDTNIKPTEAQKEAGNYKKGHIKIDGFDITIETPKGVERSGVDEQGNKWSVKMNNTYGYIRGTEGVDGDHIDLFLSDNIDNWNGNVYVIDQVKTDGSFDEHKVMYGFNSIEEAQQAYLANYSIGWKGLGAITGTTKEEFQKWVASSHRKTKPFAEYKSVKTTEGQSAKPQYGQYQQFYDEFIEGLNERKFIPNISQIRTNISQLKKKIKALESGMAMGVSSDEEFAMVQSKIDDATDQLNAFNDILYTINKQMKEAKRQEAIEKLNAAIKRIDEHQAQQKHDDNAPISMAEMIEHHAEERNDIETLSKQYEEAYTEYFKYPVQGSGANASTAPIAVIESVRYYGSRLQDALKEQFKSEHKGLVERSNAVKKHLNDIQAEVKRKSVLSFAFKDLVSEDGKYSIHINKVDGAKRTVVADLNTENIGGEGLELSFEEMANILHHNNWVEAQPTQQESAEPQTSNKLVTDERYAELKARMKAKLSGQMNMGIDPEILAIGTEMAVYHIEKGARKFIDYAKAMIEDMGDAIRPYLKSFYNGARELPEVDAAGYTAEMTPYDEVRTFDVANFDKKTPDAMAAAETVVKEQEVSKQAEQATQSIKNNRNNARKNRKKVVTSQQEMANLFGMPIADEQQTTTDYDTQRGSETENTPMGGEQRQDTTIAEPRGVDRGDDGDNVDDESRNGRLSRPSAGTKTVERKNTRNNRNARGTDYAPTTPKARYDANVAAIRLMHELQESGKSATKEQKETLRQYSGWGGLGTYFNNEFSAENKQLRELLSAEEYDAAVQSINSAYYTPATIIDTLWDIATKLGFEGGKILEGSAGIGNIIGSMPRSISEQSDIQAVEIDEVSGNILKLLYPDATVNVQGFEDTNIRNGSIDLAITNVPFVTGLRVFDKVDKDLSKKFGDIHDFCIAKNVRKLREGGLGIFITSNGTLDKSKKLREWLNAPNGGSADVIGAFRLNNDTFGGTTVTSDIIVVRKRVGGKVSPMAIDVQNASFVREGLYKTGESSWDSKSRRWIDEEKKPQMYYNDYFQQHPEFMAGEMLFAYEKGETFRPGSTGLYATEKTNQAKQLKAWVNTLQRLDNERTDTPQEQTAESTTAKEGSLVVNSKGEICVSQQGEAVSVGINTDRVKGMPKADCLKAYNRIKTALDNVLRQQIDNQDDNLLQPALKELNDAYDDFYQKYGQLNKNRSIIFLRNDVDFPSIAAIEKYTEKKDIDGKVQISTSKTNVFKGRVIGFQAEPQPTTVKDGVIASLYKHGYIDIAYISDKLGLPADEVRETVLKEGLGFENPISGTIEVRYEYLSGNVREKMEQALSNNDDGRYDTNIKALEEVTPMDIPAHLIEFQIGSSWIEPTLYADFFEDKFGVQIEPPMLVNGVWIFQNNVGNLYNDKNRSSGVYSEVRKELTFGHELGIAAMNNTPKEIKKTVKHKDYAGNEYSETISDKEATSACAVRVAEIKDDFREWARTKMQSDEALAAHFTKVYNDKFNAIVPKRIDDMFLPEHFEGAANDVTLYTHQKQAVVRGTTEPLMLAHEVGTGKTFTLISTAMEMRRLGTAKKPMIVVQNATTGQFVNEAKRLYPNAKVLTIEPNERNPEGRRAFYGKIKYNDWDLIICPQSVFNEIPDNLDRQLAFIQERIDEKVYAMEAAKDVDSETSRKLRKDLEMEVEGLEEVMAEVANGGKFTMNIAPKKKKKDAKKESAAKENAAVRAKKQLDRKTDDVQTFDELGVDALLVDEAHNYKRLGLTTNIKRTKGIDTQSSTQAASLFLKTRAVFDKCGWKNVVFATGTPISNTAAEIYTFMKYLIPKDVLMANDMYYFDDFVRNFGNISQSLEFTTSGKFKENTRFASYINLPELVRIWSSCCDTVLTKEVDYVNDKVPELEKNMHQDIFLPQTDGLVDIMRAVRATLAEYENMSGKEKKANSHIPLTMFGIAKLAAIDPRLVNVDAQDEAGSKTNKAVEEVLRSLKETERYKGTVAIFSDNYKNTIDKVEVFNLFEDIKQKLIAHGIPADQIVVMSSNMSDTKKTKTFDAVNAGEVRVIFGTTASLGTGVNIQERLHTVIHMDAPNRPMDYTQRNGRILRQGNLHKEWGLPVRILRFGVEDSLDVTAYQRLKTKAAFIDSVMDGKGLLANNQDNRTLEEEEEGLFDNPVAALSGSQYALLKQQAEREARKYRNKKQQYEADQVYIHNTLRQHAGQTKKALADIEEHKARLEKIAKMFPDGKAKVITIQGKKCKTDAEIESALKELVNKPINEQVEAARKNPNYRNSVVPMTMSFDGMEVGISVFIKRDTTYDNKVKAMRIMMHKDITFSVPALDLMDVPVMGGYVRGVLDTLREEVITGKEDTDFIEALQRGIEKRAIEDNAMRQREGKPFPFDNELRDAEAKVAEYTDLMKKELAEKEAKYAERGSDAEIDLSEFSTDDIETEDEKEERQRHRLVDEDDNARERVSLSALHEFSRELGISPRVVFDLNDIEDAKKRNSKGWYDTKTGEVVIVLPNATSDADIKETILHEVVAHKGLREVVGKDHFEEYLDKVFRGADKDTRAKIVALATKNGWNFRLATEEYMAGLAEQGFDNNGGFWRKVRKFFADMLHKAKIALGYKINDNDLRYMLWRSYKMQHSKGAMAVAEDVVMQRKLGVGNFRARLNDLKSINEQFNKELQEYINNGAKANTLFHLGMPQGVMRTFLPNLPIVMRHRIMNKSSQTKHNVNATALRNLPTMISEPIFVFQRDNDTLGVLTEIKDRDGKNVCVAIELNKTIQNGGVYLEVNDIRSIHGREASNIILPIVHNNTLKYVDKEKGLNWLSSASYNYQQEIDSKDLSTATKIVENFENPKFTPANDVPDIRFRRGSVAPPSSGVARHKYEEAVRTPNKSGSVKKFDNMAHRLQEAYQDSMLSLRELYGAILEETGNDLHDFEDAYKAENRMSSENKAQAEIYMRDFYKPVQDAVRGLIEEGAEYADIVRYMIAKHGLERNEVFSKRDAEKDGGTWDGEVKRDYSGLTELTQDTDNFTDLAQQMVDDFESAHDTSVFWDRVNAATKETLSKSYESGLMQKDTYEQVRDMFEYYIPLRGWDANVAANEYEYLSNNRLMLSPTLKTAQGRSSIADDPLATIGYMAESAIVQGNRNLMKQKFLNFVLNNPTSLATVSEQWYVKNAMGVWEPNNPVIPEDATADEVAAIVEQHEKDMEALGNDATKERAGLKLGLHATKWEGQEHTVRVSRNGKEYLIFINGNPIAAQAINGLTNPNSDPSSLQKAAMAVKNFMARAFTSQNPAFIFTNLSRDIIWAGTAVAIKEDKKYTAQYAKNVSDALLKGKMPQLIRKFQKGTLDTSVDIERYFEEFIRNGGETGFTQVNTVEDYKRDMKRFIKEAQGGKATMTKKAWRGLWNGIEFLNRSAEDTTRFAVYMTSRQMGRSVSQSVWDAKEITVNFNKKGRGTLGASVMNFAYIFFNATIQGLTNFGRLMAKHPVKTTLALSSFTAAGMIAPMLAVAMQAMFDDDDDERNGYWDLPEWVRRNNIVLFVPWSGNGFITIPLPHEVRPFYGMGELAFSCLMGKETVENALSKSAQGFASLLPLDYTGNAGNMAVNFTPTIAQPFAQLVVNKDYFGKPIYRKNDYNKLDPEWTKAYKGTNAFLVSGAKWLNEATGGDNVKSGLVDINPAVVEHIFESYLGGMGKTVNKTAKTFSMLWDKEAREWRNVPVVSSFYQEAEERTSGSQLNREYFNALDKAEETEHLFNGYKKQLKMGSMEYAEKLDSLISSPIFQQYKTVNGYKKAISKLNNALKMTTPDEREELETTIMELKAEMLDELKRLDESNK